MLAFHLRPHIHMKFSTQPALHHVPRHAATLGPFTMDHASAHVELASSTSQNGDVYAQVAFSSSHFVDIHSWNLAIKSCARSGSWMKALYLFQQLHQEGTIPERLTLTFVLIACGSQGALPEGRRIHARIVDTGFRSDSIIRTALVSMYGKHRRLDNASYVFDEMSHRDVVAWSTFITVLAQQGSGQRSLQCCSQMLQEGLMPDKIALICMLDAYIYASEKERTCVLVYALFVMQEDDIAIGTALVSLLGKCGNPAFAAEVFDKMLVRNVFIWSALISVQVQHAQSMKARQFFNDMQEQGILPNEITFISVISACTSEEDLIAGHRLHALLAGNLHECGLSLSNSLLSMYNTCGSLNDATSLFQTLTRVDIITFTSMITASVSHGNFDIAFGFLNRMISAGYVPDQVAFTALLEVGNITSDSTMIQCLHAFIIECGCDFELILTNSLLNVYCKCGSFMEAQWIFGRMFVRDSITWNAILGLYAQLGHLQEVLQLLHHMQQEVFFDKVTILNTLNCFTGLAALPHGKRLHTLVLANRLEFEVRVSTALVSMYGRCGSLPFAQQVFGETRDKDLVLWRELVMAYTSNGHGNSVKSLFDRLFVECFIPDQFCFVSIFSALCEQATLLEVKCLHVLLVNSACFSDVSPSNALMNLYGKCGGLENALSLFNKMLKRDSVSWNTLLSVYNLHSQSQESICIQDKMCWEGFLPDVITWTNRLAACVSSIHLAEGKRVHSCLHHYALDTDGFVATALLNMYGKCGNLGAARSIFDTLPARSLVSWNSMMAVYAQHGLGKEAVELFDLMLSQKALPDKATFASILASCSHAGLHIEGCRILACMENYGFPPSADDISCVIDLLGRLGRLDEAESLINAQLENATVKSLRALLSACRHQRDVERGERAAEKVISMDSNDAAAYVLLSNLYVHDDDFLARVVRQ
ncbi:hypothetical protein L7F22_034840 [Adiantum nelumboides]|nr:hypothetical protein [Adiantum nelumboides]